MNIAFSITAWQAIQPVVHLHAGAAAAAAAAVTSDEAHLAAI